MDIDKPNVINLRQEKERREHEANHNAHDRAELFMFEPFTFDEERSVGLIESDLEVVIITNFETISGICMSREDAKKLGEALIGAAEAKIPTEET